MMRVADWELDNPLKNLVELLERNPNIRGRDDVNTTLKVLIDAIELASRQVHIAIAKQSIEDSEAQIEAARQSLDYWSS